ncbi:alpha/beta fold hydrolase [Pelagibacterium halotolerans]|uniref:alpha/beta fold hydrolase n=1 Tax=Pelagibacterium halotolerans TaxID=531813 RepID=UPI003850D827
MLKQMIVAFAAVAALAITVPANAQTEGASGMNAPASTGRVPVNGVELYYEIHGKGSPLVMLHGGVNPSELFGAPLAEMAKAHQVIAVHLRGHGLSTDTDAPWRYEQMADDVAALLDALDIETADVMGWSLGGGVALQTAIRHPERVGKLVVVSKNVRHDGNFPEIQAQFEAMPGMAAEIARGVAQSPLAEMYPEIDWEVMFRKTGEMNAAHYDWSDDVADIAAPTLLVFADADMMPPEHMAEMYRLLGGGARDAGLDGSLRPTPNQLAIIPGTTHYNLMQEATTTVTDHAKAFLAD